MTKPMTVFLVATCAAVTFVSACKGKTPAPTGPSGATVTSVGVTGTAALNAVGATSQLTASATFSDGTTQNVTSAAKSPTCSRSRYSLRG